MHFNIVPADRMADIWCDPSTRYQHHEFTDADHHKMIARNDRLGAICFTERLDSLGSLYDLASEHPLGDFEADECLNVAA